MSFSIHAQEFNSLVCWDDLTDDQKDQFEDQEPDNKQTIDLFIFEDCLYSMANAKMITDISSTAYRAGFRGGFEVSKGRGLLIRWIYEGATFFVAEYTVS